MEKNKLYKPIRERGYEHRFNEAKSQWATKRVEKMSKVRDVSVLSANASKTESFSQPPLAERNKISQNRKALLQSWKSLKETKEKTKIPKPVFKVCHSDTKLLELPNKKNDKRQASVNRSVNDTTKSSYQRENKENISSSNHTAVNSSQLGFNSSITKLNRVNSFSQPFNFKFNPKTFELNEKSSHTSTNSSSLPPRAPHIKQSITTQNPTTTKTYQQTSMSAKIAELSARVANVKVNSKIDDMKTTVDEPNEFKFNESINFQHSSPVKGGKFEFKLEQNEFTFNLESIIDLKSLKNEKKEPEAVVQIGKEGELGTKFKNVNFGSFETLEKKTTVFEPELVTESNGEFNKLEKKFKNVNFGSKETPDKKTVIFDPDPITIEPESNNDNEFTDNKISDEDSNKPVDYASPKIRAGRLSIGRRLSKRFSGVLSPVVNLDDNEKHELTEKEIEELKYYRKLVSDETENFNVLSELWNVNVKSAPEDVEGDIRSAVGLAQLLIDERFAQFLELIDQCEFRTGEKLIKTSDLQGFWEMVNFQVEDVKKKFKSLQKLKENNYVVEEVIVIKKPVAKVVKPKPVKPTNAKSKFAEFRQHMMKKKTTDVIDEVQEGNSDAGVTIETEKHVEIKSTDLKETAPKDPTQKEISTKLPDVGIILNKNERELQQKTPKIKITSVNNEIKENKESNQANFEIKNDETVYLKINNDPWKNVDPKAYELYKELTSGYELLNPGFTLKDDQQQQQQQLQQQNITPKTPKTPQNRRFNITNAHSDIIKSPLLKMAIISSHGKRLSRSGKK